MDHFPRAKFFAAILALMIVPVWVGEAQAYFDPGTGSQLLQLFLAGLFGALFTIKMYWKKFKDFFKNFVTKKSEGDND